MQIKYINYVEKILEKTPQTKGQTMQNQALNSFKSYMNLPENSQNAEFSSQSSEFAQSEFAPQDIIITDDNEIKQCIEAFGEPMDILTAKEA